MASTKPKSARKNNLRTYASKKDRYKNQDKHRWRKVAAVLLSVIFFIPFTVVFYAHGVWFVWCVVTSIALLLALALVLLEWHVWKRKWRLGRISLFFLCGLLMVGGLKWQSSIVSPAARRPWLKLTDNERRKFIEVLASQTEPRERIRLGCPAANEDICVRVTPFIDAFKRGHFIVENDRVERLTLGKPTAGVVLFKYGHADAFDPQDPDQGVWVHQSMSLETIEAAFAEIGINAQGSADQNMPEDVLGIYFGIEPSEPIERDNLRKLRQDAEKQLGHPLKP
jgi:hypothetical protein